MQLVNTLVRAGSREKCRFQWLSEQGQRCWRMDCFRKAVPNCSRGGRENSVTDCGSNSSWNDQCSSGSTASHLRWELNTENCCCCALLMLVRFAGLVLSNFLYSMHSQTTLIVTPSSCRNPAIKCYYFLSLCCIVVNIAVTLSIPDTSTCIYWFAMSDLE